MARTVGSPRGRFRPARVVPALLVAASALVGCSHHGDQPTTSPLTGEPVDVQGPVVATKVDNSAAGRPWTGVEAADVVYVEPVEGGSTRLLAVFSSHLPPKVGPVRSFRESDLDVLAAYGHPGLIYSGNAPELNAALAQAPVTPLNPEQHGPAFRRDDARKAPDNLYADPNALVSGTSGLSTPQNIGFTFGPLPAGATPEPSHRTPLGTDTITSTWDPGSHRWNIAIDGKPALTADGKPVTAATVVQQSVPVSPSAVHDVAGHVSPKAQTVGGGPATILRDGSAVPGSWTRATPQDGTTFTTADGQPAPFAVGPVWVLLTPQH